MFRLRAIQAALAVSVLVLAGCGQNGSDAGGSQIPTIRMGWTAPLEEIKYVMIHDPAQAPNLGKCYDIEWSQGTTGTVTVQNMATGQLDAGTVGSLSVAAGIAKGADFVVTGSLISEKKPYFSTTWMVNKDSGIDSAADLDGKTVGASGIGNSTNLIQELYLEKEGGIKPDSYETVELPFPLQQQALAKDEINVGVFVQPFYLAAAKTGDFRTLFKLTDVIDNFPQLMQAFTREFVEENPEAVKCFVEDWATVANYVKDPANRSAVIAATAKVTKVPAEQLEPFLLTKKDFYRPANGAVDRDAVQAAWDFYRQRGDLTEDLDVEDHVVKDLLPPND